MSSNLYDPRKLLEEFINIEEALHETIANHCPDSQLSVTDDLDEALEVFLSNYNIKGEEVPFLSSQYALLHLQQKVAKTRKVLVEVNNLRAYEDYCRKRKPPAKSRYNNGKQLIYMLIIYMFLLMIVAAMFYLMYT